MMQLALLQVWDGRYPYLTTDTTQVQYVRTTVADSVGQGLYKIGLAQGLYYGAIYATAILVSVWLMSLGVRWWWRKRKVLLTAAAERAAVGAVAASSVAKRVGRGNNRPRELRPELIAARGHGTAGGGGSQSSRRR